MSPRINRIGWTAVIAVVLCAGILLGSVLNVAPIRVSGQNAVDEQTVLLQRLYQQVNPSVVTIEVRIPPSSSNQSTDPNNGPNSPQAPFGIAQGSGFVYSKDGYLVTNAHVVEDAQRIAVAFPDDTTVIATLVGTDPDSDLAVIKIDPGKLSLTSLSLADSEKITVGERAIAIGNPFGLGGSMTHGIVSAIGRSLDGNRNAGPDQRYLIPGIIQTDAAINWGNSGGPLLNGKGEVIGVNTAIEPRFFASAGGSVAIPSGVSFAVPSNIVKKVADTLISNKGKIEHSYLGIAGGTLTMDTLDLMGLASNFHGVLVRDVSSGGPADKGGVKPSTVDKELNGVPIKVGGDVIVAVDGVPVKRFEDLLYYLFVKTKPGQDIMLTVYRDGKNVDLKVTLGTRPAAS